jgi:hypothetical protein
MKARPFGTPSRKSRISTGLDSSLPLKDKESREWCQTSGREVRIIHHRESLYPPACWQWKPIATHNDGVYAGSSPRAMPVSSWSGCIRCRNSHGTDQQIRCLVQLQESSCVRREEALTDLSRDKERGVPRGGMVMWVT